MCSPEEKAAQKAKAVKPATPRKPVRPKTSTTNVTTSRELSPELMRIQTQIAALLARIGGVLPLTIWCWTATSAMQMRCRWRACTLHLISKLRADSALYLPYDGPYAGHGPRRVYGDTLNPRAIAERYLCQTTVAKDIETRIYQLQARHKTLVGGSD